ncbi:MAG: peptide transporter [candidate division NC10 bacterium]|nr:peptide transporter [candidate division NC10 bacterium]
MILYLARRLLGVVPVLILVALGSFLLVHLVPGDPAMVMLGSDATPQQIEALRLQMGLNRSLPEQFLIWMGQALRGDLGESFFLGRPVTQALMERLPATMQLAVLSLFFSLLIGVPAGILASVRQNSRWDQLVMVTAMGGISIPSFWLGLFLILVFSVRLGWLPSGGYVPIWEEFGPGLRVLILPAISLGFMQAALIARTTIGTAFGVLLGGAVIVEIVFTYPGLGRLVVLAVQRRDYPLVQGALLLTSVIYVAVNLAVDLLYSVFDPRIKYE